MLMLGQEDKTEYWGTTPTDKIKENVLAQQRAEEEAKARMASEKNKTVAFVGLAILGVVSTLLAGSLSKVEKTRTTIRTVGLVAAAVGITATAIRQ